MTPNEFGDSFGVLNALFSGLAFAGLLYSIRLQAKEFSDSRNEMKSQGEEFLAQTKAMNRQAFDSAFFQLLNFNNEIAKGIQFQTSCMVSTNNVLGTVTEKKEYNGAGRSAFREMYLLLLDVISANEFRYIEDPLANIQENYMAFYRLAGEYLAHYFRNLYQTLNFIDSSDIFNDYEKKKYSNIVRAQVSNYELALLFYNGLSPLGIDKFKVLLEKYEFFEHIPSNLNIPIMLVGYYDVSVFGWSNKDMYFNHLRSKIDFCRKNENMALNVFCNDLASPIMYTSDTLPTNGKLLSDIKKHRVIWLEILRCN